MRASPSPLPALLPFAALALPLLLVHVCEAGVFLDKVKQAADDAREDLEVLGSRIKKLFAPDGPEEGPSAPSGGIGTATAATPDVADGTTTPDPRYIIGSIPRCAAGERYFANECRSVE